MYNNIFKKKNIKIYLTSPKNYKSNKCKLNRYVSGVRFFMGNKLFDPRMLPALEAG